jgi:hypothetical protein
MHFGRIPQILQSGGWEDWLMRSLFNAADKVLVMDRASYTSLKGGNTRDAGC